MLKVVRHPSDQGGTKGESAPPLLRGAGGIRSEIYLQFNYNYLLILMLLLPILPNFYIFVSTTTN
ncbi:MAG: hypothetical protein DWQ53_03635 [Microcystis flos-aquae DF17]|nr:MAG: hypothetical protein DWQ53_03635 [Microcystis flos-aquae DF17]TRT63039.1 MAG: hypothetical protein EWV67_12260 [Microcystis sp. M_QC_C_20170808_M2Col]TRT66790.1 MAG: hypothetical protein EWV68_14255 [Microcystis sp. M_QC_C_20170808_M9Col]